MKNTLGSLAIALGLTYGADNQQTASPNYAARCIEWLGGKLAAGVAMDRAMAYPTANNLANFWETLRKLGHEQLIPKTGSPFDK